MWYKILAHKSHKIVILVIGTRPITVLCSGIISFRHKCHLGTLGRGRCCAACEVSPDAGFWRTALGVGRRMFVPRDCTRSPSPEIAKICSDRKLVLKIRLKANNHNTGCNRCRWYLKPDYSKTHTVGIEMLGFRNKNILYFMNLPPLVNAA